MNAGEYVDGLQARGRYTFTAVEVAEALGLHDLALDAVLRRLKDSGRVAAPRRGFFVVTPVEYREVGGPPADWWVDDLMRYLNQPYYVGLMSAAALHGAAHQSPMRFQVITDRPLRSILSGRTHMTFTVRRNVAEETGVERRMTHTGHMTVSLPETTALDLVRFPLSGGGLNNVATILGELQEVMSTDRLREAAGHRATPDIQRLGYLCDFLGLRDMAAALHWVLGERRYRPVLLSPGTRQSAAQPTIDARWRVVVNSEVDPDQ